MPYCGFACSHCGKCGDDPISRHGLLSVAGMCDSCGHINEPKADVCSKCGSKLMKRESKIMKDLDSVKAKAISRE